LIAAARKQQASNGELAEVIVNIRESIGMEGIIIMDTGALVALANENDQYHTGCVAFVRGIRYLNSTKESYKLIVPDLVQVEAAHLLAKAGGSGAAAGSLELLLFEVIEGERMEVVCIEGQLQIRTKELMMQHATWPLGLVDAAVFATAEAMETPHVATIDRRHMSRLGTSKRPYLILWPQL
jgi:predicted nucleic acid-binding protein